MRHFSASKTALCLARPARYFSGCPRIFSQAPKVSSKSRRSQQSSANERFNYNSNPFDHSDISEPHLSHYPLLTASQLSAFSSPPKRVRLLTRDFIDDALYNPNYGYFNQQAVIFDPDEAVQKQDIGNQQQLPQQGFKFNEIRNSSAFDREVLRRYGVLEGEQSSVALPGRDASSARQVWHTPTELFKPWYARAVARFLVEQHKQNATSNEPLLIYELGAGNGTLMRGVMDYLSLFEPEVYASTTYHIIEISNRLSELQRAKAGENHAGKVEVINQDVFAYNRAPETRRCFVLAFEVLDNLAHDLVRFTLDPQTDPVPLQASVSISSTGEFVELYEPVQDALIADFLRLREGLDLPPLHASWPSWMRQLRAAVPFSANLSRPYYIPTKLLKLLRGLNTSFPHHRLLLSDFSSLPDAIPGWNAPVVQTRYKGQTVACTTYLVSQGFFDIFFPTDFKLLQHLYGAVRRTWTSESGVEQQAELEVCSHGAFLERWGETSETRLRNGENPMLDHYQNAAFAYTR